LRLLSLRMTQVTTVVYAKWLSSSTTIMEQTVDGIPNLLERAVLSLLSSDQAQARRALRGIDFPALCKARLEFRSRIWAKGGLASGYKSLHPGTGRQSTRRADIRATFERDRYTCRYLHCRRRTVAIEVLKLISHSLPDLLPRHSNWQPVETHILYWTYTTSLEHIVPFPAGGTSNRQNLLTACYMCNDAKNYVPHDILGWDIGPPAEYCWFGLTEYIPELRKAIKSLNSPGSEGGNHNSLSDLMS